MPKKIANTFFLVFLLSLIYPFVDELSWFITQLFWEDRSRVDEGSALIGSLVGAAIYGIMIVFFLWILKRIWSSQEEDAEEDETSLPAFSNIETERKANFKTLPKVSDNINPETKLCPFCAEEVKYMAIKCKHCQSDIAHTFEK